MTQKIDTSMLEDVASKTPSSAQDADVGKVVQLNASGLIPSAYLAGGSLSLVDGRHLALEIADLKGAALNFGAGQADPFDSDTIGATSTNETYDASNDWYSSSTNMTLINAGLTAASAPSTGRISVQAEFVDSATINTDLTAEISRDGGTTWTAVTLTAGATNGNFIMYSGEATISAQPSGTSMKYRVKTLNNKNIRVSGVVLRWS
tara:strand:+ start:5453 stop:6070 length:618 start_codon:yes stop_codon:yes gene_type:complete